VGSAQRRQSGAFLQHGSIVLAADADRIRTVFPAATDPLAGMTTLAALLGRLVGFDDVVSALAAGLGEGLDAPLIPGGLSASEMELVQRLVAEKYATEAWTTKAEVPADIAQLLAAWPIPVAARRPRSSPILGVQEYACGGRLPAS